MTDEILPGGGEPVTADDFTVETALDAMIVSRYRTRQPLGISETHQILAALRASPQPLTGSASRPSAIVEEPMAVTEAVTALDGFVEGLLGSMDWVGTGTVKSGAADEKEARDDWTRIRAALNAALTVEPAFGPGDDTDPPLTALKRIAEDGSLPDNARAGARLAASEINRLRALTVEPAHPDDAAVDRFATAMKAKLAKKRAEGRGGWERKDECTAEFLSELLCGHVEKGDPLDVGNLAMMLHQRGERILTVEPEAGEVTLEMIEAFERGFKRQLGLRHAERFKPKPSVKGVRSAEEVGLRAMLLAMHGTPPIEAAEAAFAHIAKVAP